MEERKLQLHDWLDDLCVRFVINLPQEELESVERICFQIEEAQWFYEDFIRPLDPTLPSLNLRQFCLLMFQHCPLFFGYDQETFIAAYSQFLAYKIRVPVRGAILLNDAMDHVVLVKGWKKGANWSFPRGKINKNEPDLDCAIREVREETGYDVYAAGLARDGDRTKYLEVTMKGQHMKLYVFKGVSMDTAFQPQTRKEISKIQWWKLSTLPGWQKRKNADDHNEEALNANKLYMVAPFLGPLRKWIGKQRRVQSKSQGFISDGDVYAEAPAPVEPGYPPHEWQQPLGLYTSGQGLEPSANVLQQTNPPPATVQEPILNVDASDHLKRLLSVGGPANVTQDVPKPPPQQHANASSSNAANLLALLKPDASVGPKPHTPFDQIISQKEHAESPHPVRARQAELSDYAPPPSFPYIPNQPATQQPPQDSLVANKQMLLNLFQANPAASSNQSVAGRALMNQLSQAQAAPIEHQGRDLNVPAPSQLPKPTLSTHAQNLLAAFKSGAPPPMPKATGNQQTVPHELPANRASEILTQLQQWQPGHNYSRTREHLLKEPEYPKASQAVQAASPPRQPTVTSPSIAQPSAVNPNVHPDSLLKLFQSPSTPNPSAPAVTNSVDKLAPAPVELSAVTSPGPPPARQLLATQQLQAEQQRGVEETNSSTVTGPLPQASAAPSNLPSRPAKSQSKRDQDKGSPSLRAQADFDISDSGTVRRGKAVSTGRTLWQPEDSSPASKQTSVKILKRPGSSRADQSAPTTALARPQSRHASSTTSSPRAPSTKDTAPKPFQPKILKRPEQGPSVEETRATANALGLVASPSPKSAGTEQDHKQALLSIFARGRTESPVSPATADAGSKMALAYPPSDITGTLTSPGPELVMARSDTQQSFPGNNSAQRSRVNSVMHESRRDSASSARDRTGSSTPMSPQDKGFLLSYLEGVVKNAGR